METPLTYVFKCGCRHKVFHAEELNWGARQRMVRFCPSCYNAALSVSAIENQACTLNYIEGTCKICGNLTRLSKNSTTNARLVLCLEHKHLRNRINREFQKMQRRVSQKAPAKRKEQIAICPCCRKKHVVPSGIRFATKTPWKYCSACEYKKHTIDDNFACGNDLAINGQYL